jgi:hypothetical protein
VHRESMCRVLSENPESLKSILDALDGVLQPVLADPSGSTVTLRAAAQEM